MQPPIRILIDQDSVLYDLHTPWLAEHNAANPDHILKKEDHLDWNAQQPCVDNNCPADIYSYFNNPKVWTEGSPEQDSQEITKEWADQGHELAIVTKAANSMCISLKAEWLSHNYPHIPNIFILAGGNNKHWIQGDIIIDDAVHNLAEFEGICILYDQPWNRKADMLRANNWQHVNQIVRAAVILLEDYPYYIVQEMLERMQQEGLL